MTEELCPRCQENNYTPYGEKWNHGDAPFPALSRVAQIHICSRCGVEEAMRDFSNEAPIPPDEWPVKGEADE